MKRNNIILVVAVLIGLPLLFWAMGDFPRRTVLKEVLSVITLISFFMITGQFYFSRIFKKVLNLPSMVKLTKYHKVLGYVFIGILIFHPFFIVFPRFFEAGVEPLEAFITILTTFNSTGIILGLIAWILILTIGLTSFFRKKLALTYIQWRLIHGILSIMFIVVASWHAIDLGRHTDLPILILIIILAGVGVLLLLQTYLLKPQKK